MNEELVGFVEMDMVGIQWLSRERSPWLRPVILPLLLFSVH